MVLLLAALALPQTPEVARGSAIFATSCGIGYCHGKQGAASRGPRLAGRKFDRDYLVKVVTEGAGNGNMPSFAKLYSKSEIAAVVAYILSLGGSPASASEPSPASAAASADHSGRAVFLERCSPCHQYRGQGGEVGPDLTAQAGRPRDEILRDIVEPNARLSLQPVEVLTTSSERIRGVPRQQTSALIRIYDMAGLPPVLRTLYKDQVQSITPLATSPMPADFGRTLTEQQLRDLVGFLTQP